TPERPFAREGQAYPRPRRRTHGEGELEVLLPRQAADAQGDRLSAARAHGRAQILAPPAGAEALEIDGARDDLDRGGHSEGRQIPANLRGGRDDGIRAVRVGPRPDGQTAPHEVALEGHVVRVKIETRVIREYERNRVIARVPQRHPACYEL